jgi:hypothetical protein
MSAKNPQFVEFVSTTAGEDVSPTCANFANVSGDGDMLAVDFFYIHPSRVQRIFNGQDPGPDAERDGDTVVVKRDPVARLAIPMTTAAELAIELLERLGEGAPNIREVIVELGGKLRALASDVDARVISIPPR